VGEEGQAREGGLNSAKNTWSEGYSAPLQTVAINAKDKSLGFGEGGQHRKKGKKQKKNNLIRKKEIIANLVLGVNLHIDEAMEVAKLTLIGKAKEKKYSTNYIQEWAVKCWQKAQDKTYEVSTLAKGWFMIKFIRKEAMEWVMERNWSFGKSLIIFKR